MTAVVREPPAVVRAGRRAFWGVMLSFIVHGLVVATWVSRISSIKSRLGLSDGALGLSLLGAAIGSLTAIPICGSLVTRYGSKRVVMWTGVGFCAAMIVPALAWNEATLFLALLAYGVFAGSNDVAMNAQAVSTEKLLGYPAMSRFHAMFSLGGILGAAAGGVIAGRGIPPLPHLAVGGAALVLFAMLGPRLMAGGTRVTGPKAKARLTRLPTALLALSAIGFCILLSEGAMADWTGVYLKQVLQASDGLAPSGYAVFSAAMAIFRFAGDAITLRLGRPLTIRTGALVAAAGIALSLSAHSTGWALVGFAAAGAGFSSIVPLIFAAGGRVPSVGEGAGVATVSGIGYLGFLAGPPAIGFISEMSSLRMGLFLLVVLSTLAALLVSVAKDALRTPD